MLNFINGFTGLLISNIQNFDRLKRALFYLLIFID